MCLYILTLIALLSNCVVNSRLNKNVVIELSNKGPARSVPSSFADPYMIRQILEPEGYSVFAFAWDGTYNVTSVTLNGEELLNGNESMKFSHIQAVTAYWKDDCPLLLSFSEPGIIFGSFIYLKHIEGNRWGKSDIRDYTENNSYYLDSHEVKMFLDDLVAEKNGEKIERAFFTRPSHVLPSFLFLVIYLIVWM